MFSDIASPVSSIGPKRITQPAIAMEDLPEIHIVVISHDHYDHLDTNSIRALGNTPTYFVPLGLREWFIDKGIAGERVVEMDWWDERHLRIGSQEITVTATPSQHFSGRGLTDRYKTLWASWSVTWPDFRAWFGGDTGYNDLQFKEIGERLKPIDLAVIPIGSYEPRHIMGPIHVNPAEAVLIHQDLQATASMAIHWGAFILSAEGALTPLKALLSARTSAGILPDEFAAFAVGETRHYVRGERDAQSFRLMSLNGPVSDRASFGMSSTRSEMMLR
jgi:L-ascorbate metabolism protein UlaG (beta-lactamase superfamily)